MVNCLVFVVLNVVDLYQKEKDDYILGLWIVVKYNVIFVLMIEDDVVLLEDFFNYFCFVLKYKMLWKFLKQCKDWVFLKFYYFEKWQGFGWLELLELVVFGFVGGCFVVWVDLKCRIRII